MQEAETITAVVTAVVVVTIIAIITAITVVVHVLPDLPLTDQTEVVPTAAVLQDLSAAVPVLRVPWVL